MTILDKPGELLEIDSLGMFDAARGLPEQCEEAIEVARGVSYPKSEGITNIVVFGMGGSGMGGRILAAHCAEHFPLPVEVVAGYTAPGYITPDSLVFAISYSGNTEETLEAVHEAANYGGRIVCVTSGGKLAEFADAHGYPLIQTPNGLQPRAAIGALAMPALVALEEMGLSPGIKQELDATIEQLRARRETLLPEVPIADNPAKRLALAMARKIPLIYGGGPVGSAAALRLKCQINENAKMPAFWNSYPELDHNEIVGWGQNGDATRQLVQLIELRNDFEHPQIRKRFEITRRAIGECISGVEEVCARGDHPLAQLFDLIYIGDYASLYLAAGEGVDPGPVEVIARLKAELA
ncbi:MAG: bifunctional phosphoglucose/phosphomannose isomerase [Acidobacteria bacterium]|nr:MAG: bifunctional phosphoglucose/phosphomannose isomerase [Acidobacteriota bacterium]